MLDNAFLVAERQRKDLTTSKYCNVTYVKRTFQWQGYFTVNGEKHWAGEFLTEVEAAIAINAKCDELGIPHRNKGPELPPFEVILILPQNGH